MRKRIGLIVNPIAGMGGSVGLKGTDGELYGKALQLGAKPVTPARTREILSRIRAKDKIELNAAPGRMGEDHARKSGLHFTVTAAISGETGPEDTKRMAREMVREGVELLIVVGGDGTARDIYDAVHTQVPVVAVPSGVKVFSSVFATSARAAAELVDQFIEGAPTTEQEVLDIDEEAFRRGRLSSRLYGYLLVPERGGLLQAGKECSSGGPTAGEKKREIARHIVSGMHEDVLYLLGPGTTVKALADELGVSKTLLGVDAVTRGRLVGEDLNEEAILGLLERCGVGKIVVTPIGGNGFIFGRGNKQFTPEVIRRIGRDNLIIVATRDKLVGLEALRVDTGDFELDRDLSGYTAVITGAGEEMKMEIRC